MIIDSWEIFKNTLLVTWLVLWKLWPLWAVLLVFVIIRLFFDWLDLEIDNWHIRRKFKKGEVWRSDRELLQWLRSMKPSEFEKYIADLFRRMGYETEVTGGSYDRGIDVIVEKDGIKHYIQCKKFITQEVSVGAVRDFYGAIADHVANGKGYFITTNKFTLEAERFVEDKPIELIDGFRLVDYIRQTGKNNGKQ
jgi:restriction system protein